MDSPPPLFTAGQEIATFLVSYGILSKAWVLARNTESFILEEDENDSIAYVAIPSFHNIDDFIVKESKYGEGNIQTDNTVFSDCLKGEDDKPALVHQEALKLLARNTESFILAEDENDGIAYVAFPSFHNIDDFIVKESEYGEGNIQTDNTVFSDCLKGEDDEPALVHQGALNLFLHIMKNTDFEAKINDQLQIYTDEKEKKLKPIIFVGHFLGGAVATLATLWVLEKRLSKSSPFCITFGCPLVGDARLVEAVLRENWGGNFCHVVSKNDIAPRMLLAPIQSIVKPLSAVFPYWQGILPYSFVQEDCRTLLENVMKYTCPGVLDEINDRRSPYRPVGTYMLCSSHGAACIENSVTVLELLHLTMQSQEKSSDDIVMACILEHTDYGSVPGHVTQNSTRARKIGNCSSDSDMMGISLQIQAIDVEAQNDDAQGALRKAGEIEDRGYRNVDKLPIYLSQNQSLMAEIEWYKERCENGPIGRNGYYDAFKKQDERAINANLRRVKLAEFWDEIIEMWENHKLPSDFQSQNKWINAGNTYRKLMEPLDIAYYYRANSNGNYLSDGRPNRHKVLQKWMEAKEKTRSSRGKRPRTKFASLTEDSWFWANVEEARKELENLKQGQHQSPEGLEEFEDNVTRMVNYRSISLDIFLKNSSSMMWWEEWKEYNKNRSPDWSSPLSKIMETESWKR